MNDIERLKAIHNQIYQITQGLDCSPKEINTGLCDQWANAVKDAFPDAEIWETHWNEATIMHQFIKLGELFYDAERPQGVQDYMNLPIFTRLYSRERQPASRIV